MRHKKKKEEIILEENDEQIAPNTGSKIYTVDVAEDIEAEPQELNDDDIEQLGTFRKKKR